MERKNAVVVGASSGIGFEVSRLLLKDGWTLGIAARRRELLEVLQHEFPDRVTVLPIDVTRPDASELLEQLFQELRGVDLYLHVVGIGKRNVNLEADIETATVKTNVLGFTQSVDTAFRYMAEHDGGHIAVITSIAGTKGLGAAPSYSASKAFQNTYIEALEQLAAICGSDITFTDIRPGFVDTDLLKDGRKYPMLLDKHDAARMIVKAIYRKKHVQVIDWRYKILTSLWKLIPSALWRRLPLR